MFECPEWLEKFQGIITVCDRSGIIVYMNERSVQNFQKDGGRDLIGKSLLDCHSGPAKTKLTDLMEHAGTNIYFTVKDGHQRLIHQAPLFENGRYEWFAELIFDLPEDVPTYIRS